MKPSAITLPGHLSLEVEKPLTFYNIRNMARLPSGTFVQIIDVETMLKLLFDQIPDFPNKSIYRSFCLSPREGWGVVRTMQGTYLLCQEGHGWSFPLETNAPRLTLRGVFLDNTLGQEILAKTVFNLPFIQSYITEDRVPLENFFVYWSDQKDHSYLKWANFFKELRNETLLPTNLLD